MKLTLIGATGRAGSAILGEALERGHEVTAIVRDPKKVDTDNQVSFIQADLLNLIDVKEALKDSTHVISAYGPSRGSEEVLIEATKNLITASKSVGVERVLTIGGAGSLALPTGELLVDSGTLPPEWMPIVNAHIEALNQFKNEADLDWVVLRPQMFFEEGEKKGSYRVGKDALLFDNDGRSNITFKDFAVAIIDELENQKHSKEAYTVGY